METKYKKIELEKTNFWKPLTSGEKVEGVFKGFEKKDADKGKYGVIETPQGNVFIGLRGVVAKLEVVPIGKLVKLVFTGWDRTAKGAYKVVDVFAAE